MRYSTQGALKLAAAQRTEMAAAEVRLWQYGALVPDDATTLAEFDAAAADYTGYAAAVVTWQAAGLLPGGGASYQGSVQFATASPYTTPNTIGGFYLVDTTGTDAVIGYQAFAAPGVPMQTAGQIIPITILMPTGVNS